MRVIYYDISTNQKRGKTMDFDVIQPNYELRACSRQQLQGYWKKLAFAYFSLAVIYSPYYIFSFWEQLHDDVIMIKFISGVLGLAVAIVAGPFSLGFVGLLLKRIRGQEIRWENIFDGFKNFGSAFVLSLCTAIFTFLWTLLLIVPGFIKAYAYSMAFFILHDNPKMDPLEAIKQSQIMMKGYKWKLFLLQLSFIGWAFLCVLTLGIGFFWLYPYMNLSIANFYENLKKNQEKALLEGQQAGQTPEVDSNNQ